MGRYNGFFIKPIIPIPFLEKHYFVPCLISLTISFLTSKRVSRVIKRKKEENEKIISSLRTICASWNQRIFIINFYKIQDFLICKYPSFFYHMMHRNYAFYNSNILQWKRRGEKCKFWKVIYYEIYTGKFFWLFLYVAFLADLNIFRGLSSIFAISFPLVILYFVIKNYSDFLYKSKDIIFLYMLSSSKGRDYAKKHPEKTMDKNKNSPFFIWLVEEYGRKYPPVTKKGRKK